MADYGEVPSFSSVNYQLISLGPKNEDTLAHTLLNTCLDEGVDAILPIRNSEVAAVAKAKILFNEFNITVLLPDAAVVDRYLNVAFGKTENWLVLDKGEVLFANQELETHTIEPGLSGAFYSTAIDGAVKLTLITI